MIAIDQIIRTKRTTLDIRVEPDGKLLVRAPLYLDEDLIHIWVQAQEEWIRTAQERARAHYPHYAPKQYISGEEFLYLGKSYALELVEMGKPPLTFDGAFHLARAAAPRAAAVFKRWYREQAFRILSERVEWYAVKHGFAYRQIKITSARERFGSCGANGNLCFAWWLVKAPLLTIDYAVVHELLHLQHRNHSKQYWANIKEMLPEFMEGRNWLTENWYALQLE